jgi:NADP-dependent 3-hydroxy acid dehydrogenase YdfG
MNFMGTLNFSDKPVILITGASSGFGEAVARLFTEKGYRVVLAARRFERLQALADEIVAKGGQALPVKTDVSRLEDIQQLVHVTLKEFGQIDVLFNNAGFGRLDWLEKLDPHADVQAQLDVNVLGLIWMTQAVLPHMIARRQGHIINMASVAGLIATPSYAVYAASKFAVRGFSEALRREVGVYGIHVSTIYPGGAETEFAQVAGIQRATNIHTPSFMVLSAEEVARAVWRLAQRPRRSLVMPWLLGLAAWGNAFFPGLYDWVIERLFVLPERHGGKR